MTWPRGFAPVALIALSAFGCAPETRDAVFAGGTVIAGDGSAAIEDATVVVVDGRIQCVGTEDSCAAPADADAIDTSGFYLVPGLVDAHIHPRFGTSRALTERDQRLRFLLGITLTRDASTANNLEANLEAAEEGADAALATPRLVVAARVDALSAASDETLANDMRRFADMGATAVKVHDMLPAHRLPAIVAAAETNDLPVYGHSWLSPPVRSIVPESVDAGFAGLSHVLGVSPIAVPVEVLDAAPEFGSDPFRVWRRSLVLEADSTALDSIATALASRVWWEPLLVAELLWGRPYRFPPGLHQVFQLPFVAEASQERPPVARSEADEARLSRSFEVMLGVVRRFHEAGGVVVTGSDEVLAPGLALHEEIRILTEAGLSNKDALAAATIRAAEVVGVADSLGTIEVGKLADFVVLEGNPLDDVANLQLVSRVVKAGVIHNPATILEQLHDDMRDRTTRPGPRLLIGLLATVIVIGLTVIAVFLQGRGRGPRAW